MVLNRSEEEGYHYTVKLLGKLIELPVDFRDSSLFFPPKWVGR
jgi:hypothetical protein